MRGVTRTARATLANPSSQPPSSSQRVHAPVRHPRPAISHPRSATSGPASPRPTAPVCPPLIRQSVSVSPTRTPSVIPANAGTHGHGGPGDIGRHHPTPTMGPGVHRDNGEGGTTRNARATLANGRRANLLHQANLPSQAGPRPRPTYVLKPTDALKPKLTYTRLAIHPVPARPVPPPPRQHSATPWRPAPRSRRHPLRTSAKQT